MKINESEKVLLKEMNVKDDVKKLIDKEKGKYKLNIGKNVILVKDDSGQVVRKKVVMYTGEDSKVQGSLKDETDIKNILKKYGRTGVLPIMKEPGLYGDFSSVPSYQEAQNILLKAQKQFEALSSDLRKKFDNDPEKFLEFCGDEKNLDEMRKLGLAKELEPDPLPVKVEVINKVVDNEKK